VLRRSEQQMADDRFETSEFLQQVFDDGSIGESHTMLSAAQGAPACLGLRDEHRGWGAVLNTASGVTVCLPLHGEHDGRLRFCGCNTAAAAAVRAW
jgi:hypothetical protein